MKKIFKTIDTELQKYNDTIVLVGRELTESEADITEVGKMFKVTFFDGVKTDVFEDELISL